MVEWQDKTVSGGFSPSGNEKVLVWVAGGTGYAMSHVI